MTRLAAGPVSEAASYWEVARILEPAWTAELAASGRVLLDEYARDSLENVLLPLLTFRHHHLSRRPVAEVDPPCSVVVHVTLVGFPFKKKRFTELHFPTVSALLAESPSRPLVTWHLAYLPVRVDPSTDLGPRTADMLRTYTLTNDEDNVGYDTAFAAFLVDPLGRGPVLSGKRTDRNPFHRQFPMAGDLDLLPSRATLRSE
jgi:hypothetical protein